MMTNAAQAWAIIWKSNMKRLQVVQNRALRFIGGYDWYTCIDKMHSDVEIINLMIYEICDFQTVCFY